MDLHALDYAEFELLIGLLLRREGYEILKTPAPPGHVAGADYEVVDPSGAFQFVEVKHFERPVPLSQIDRFLGDIDRLRASKPDARGLLVLSGMLATKTQEALGQRAHISVWDGKVVERLLAKHPDVLASANQAASARTAFFALQATLVSGGAESKAAELVKRLRAVSRGRDHWKSFENLGVEVLSHVFSPALGAPDIQSRSDDGLDIIDAIFPIRSRDYPWSYVRSEYQTRFVVAEFKNYSDPIGQRQVESITQYLWRPAKRNFGLLISRSEPSESAIVARRRAWLEAEKCIVFLHDDDLVDMLQSSEGDSDPFDIIDTQLENFFRGLTP